MSEHEMTQTLPKVLIVDDSRIVRATLKKHLGEFFELSEEGDGEAAWTALMADREHQLQVLISDLSMPKLDGLGLLQRVRASDDPYIKQMPVIIISGEEEPAIKENAVRLGANDFISKSTDKIEMVSRVGAAVQLSKTLRELQSSRELSANAVTTDVITGLGTLHLLQLQGKQAFAYAQRHQAQLTAVYLQFDTMAASLAEVPPAVADQALSMLAKFIASKLRKEDTIAYLGNYRFGLISPTSDLQEGVALAARLHKAIAGVKINYKGSVIRTTASVGVANNAHDLSEDVHALLGAAEKRLEESLAAGGNRVTAQDVAHLMLTSPAPAIARALQLLADERSAEVKPHLAVLVRQLLPLLELANQEMGLGFSLTELKNRLSPN